MNPNRLQTKYLLSIDGGGIRGIIPAMALAQLESDMKKPANQIFDFVAGTSTGAIIAAAVAAGIPATRIVDLYVRRSGDVFGWVPIWSFLKRLVRGHMYSTRRLNQVIQEELGDKSSWRLDDSPIDMLITAKGVPDGKPWYFVKNNPGNSQRTGGLALVDCVTASAAAPTYFEPWTTSDSKIGALVDGGVGVTGNPVYQACVEAFDYTRDHGGNPRYRPETTLIVSLGTGFYNPTRRPTWIWPWLNWILAEMMASPAEQQTELVRKQYPGAKLYRLDIEFEEDIPLDGIRQIESLQQYGQRLSEQLDWVAILNGTEETFRIDTTKKARRSTYGYKPAPKSP